MNEAVRHFRALVRIPGSMCYLFSEGHGRESDPLSLYLRALCLEGMCHIDHNWSLVCFFQLLVMKPGPCALEFVVFRCGVNIYLSALCRKSVTVVGDFGSHGQGQPTNSQKGNADKQEGPYIGQLLD